MKKRGVSERRIVDVLVRSLRETHKVRREVRHYEKSIDVVALDVSTGNLIAIEAKTGNWSRAIQQAVVNLSAANRSYIAMWTETSHRVPVQVLEDEGIGLIEVGAKWGEVRVLRDSVPSRFVNSIVCGRLRTLLCSQESE